MGIGNARGVALHKPRRSEPSAIEVHPKIPSAVRSSPLKRKWHKRDARARIPRQRSKRLHRAGRRSAGVRCLPRLRAQDYPTGANELNSALRVEHARPEGGVQAAFVAATSKVADRAKRQRADTPRAIVPLAKCAEVRPTSFSKSGLSRCARWGRCDTDTYVPLPSDLVSTRVILGCGAYPIFSQNGSDGLRGIRLTVQIPIVCARRSAAHTN